MDFDYLWNSVVSGQPELKDDTAAKAYAYSFYNAGLINGRLDAARENVKCTVELANKYGMYGDSEKPCKK